MTTTRTARPNTYAGTCSDCAGHVAAGTGLLGGRVNGHWTVSHIACPAVVAVHVAPRPRSRTWASTLDCGHAVTRPVRGCFDCAHQIGL